MGPLVGRNGVDNTSSILPFPLSLLRLSRNTKISDSREEVSALQLLSRDVARNADSCGAPPFLVVVAELEACR